MNCIDPNKVRLIVIDSFCGAGGVTQGFHNAMIDGEKCVAVIIGINHDAKAIASHKANHPETKHYTEDFRSVNIHSLLPIIAEAKIKYPNAKVMFWMSAECTHHSIAKGGMSRDADSRSLPEYAYNYIQILQPDIVGVENVKEFLDWGPLQIKIITGKKGNELYCPLDKKERPETEGEKQYRKLNKIRKYKRYNYLPTYIPIKERKKEYYNAWRDTIKSFGYHYDYKLLNAADFGAYTSRLRYFGLFAKDQTNIVFPKPTHSKTAKNGLKKWKGVKDVLDFNDEGESIFDRTDPLCENTLTRVHSGLIRFVAGGKENFMLKYNSMNQNGSYIAPGTDEPCPVISTQNRLGVCFISKAFSGHPDSKNISVDGPAGSVTCVDHHQFISTYFSPGYNKSVNDPAGTIRCKDCMSLVSPNFISAYYGNGHNNSVEVPASTITCKDRLALVQPHFLCSYNYKDQPKDINNPAPTILTKDRYSLISPNFIMNNYSGGGIISDINRPCPSVLTNPKQNLISCNWLLSPNFNNVGSPLESPSPVITANRKHHYLVNPQYSSEGSSVDSPCFTLIARMDKRPPSLVEVITETDKRPSFIKIVGDSIIYEIYDTDTPMIKQIKEFMAMYGIIDIKMRMLKILELLLIMGFPIDYILIGSQADQKKFIGNAVECTQSQVLAEAVCISINESLK